MLNMLKRLIGRLRPWKRWEQSELDAVQRKLAETAPEEFGIEESLSAAEWIVNRHVPDGTIQTEADYERVRASLRARIEEKVHRPSTPAVATSPPPFTFRDFETRILPLLRRIGILPSRFAAADSHQFAQDLFHACTTHRYDVWRRQSYVFDRHATENLDFHSLTVATAAAIDSYERLVRAKAEGSTAARGMSPLDELCPIALQQIDEREYPIDDLLAAYSHPDGDTPILPHPACRNFQRDGGGWCRCLWVAAKKPDPPGLDPEFMAWMRTELGATSEARRTDKDRARRDFLERLRGDVAAADRRIAEAQRDLETARRTPPDLTAKLLTEHLKVDELRRLQLQSGLRGHRSKADIAAQLLAEPSAVSEIAAARAAIHSTLIRWAEGSVRGAISERESTLKRIAAYEEAWGMEARKEQ